MVCETPTRFANSAYERPPRAFRMKRANSRSRFRFTCSNWQNCHHVCVMMCRFTGWPGFSSLLPFCLLRCDEFETKTTQVSPLRQTVHCRLSELCSPALLLQSRVQVGEQGRQPTTLVAEDGKSGLFSRTCRYTPRAAMAGTESRLFEEEIFPTKRESSNWLTDR